MRSIVPVFIHVPRTGGTSISAALGIQIDHIRASETRSGFRFGFVRHPYNRFMSLFQFAQIHGDVPPEASASEFAKQIDTSNETWKPMAWWLDAPMQFIGRYEYLEQGVRYVYGCAGLGEPNLPHLNSAGPHSAGDLTERARRELDMAYAEDFARFGYEAL